MKKFLKIFFISVGSLLAVAIIIICIAVWLVFTPKRFTPIVRKQADKFITCKSEIGEVELTFFSTFPNFGIKVKQFLLINPTTGAQSDTLVKVDELVAVIDAKAYWKRNEIILVGLEMSGGSVNVFADSLGKTNYDIFPADTATASVADSATTLPSMEIRNVELSDINLNYSDQSIKLNTVISELNAKFSGTVIPDSITVKIDVTSSLISFEYAGEKYLQKASVKINLPVDVILSRQFIRFKNAGITVNGLDLLLNGTVENDTVSKNMITDLSYSFSSWQLKNVLALVPASYNSYFKGIDADGLISSQGTIKGIMNDKAMPLLDIQLQMDKGVVKYSGFPLPLHDIEGDIAIRTDLKTDAISYVNIRKFSAKTPLSSFSTQGKVNHLFGDIYCDLTSGANLTLDEFNQMIPASMKMKMKGNASGKIRSAFSISQIEKMQLERIKLSGSVTFSDFSATYDSISLKTSRSKIDFSLPNQKAASGKTRFAFATFVIDNLTAGKIESYNAYLKNASLSLETSDARDTTRIPDLICSFSMDSLSAGMDTMSINISKPSGKLNVSPRAGSSDEPEIFLSYNSGQLITVAGKSSFASKALNLETEIVNDNKQKDIFLQWLVKGFVDLNQGKITMDGLSNPIVIPALKMNFDPEKFNIKESKLVIDKSDFQLTGTLSNILSYFRGDSILRGDFAFLSNNTDVAQLMALTNGIGNDSIKVAPENEAIDTAYTGPYMVPKRVDFFLATNIKRATIGIDTATNIKGSVQVHDGILILDGLSFTTPAAKMQLTAMYRTPRKNHLYVGLDYHMLDIEIEQLLKMIPDIDSLMPMLRSFKGKGEFHIAVETYLDSMYNVKKSTLRGASSIRGTDLVLMDGQTFSEIAKTLMFKKKTENKVDSLSVEFTIFRNEIDIYPFLIVMDKYKAVIAGRHNFDMSFNYHISVVDCPLPIKLGIDVKGNENDLKYNLAKCRYAEYFRPASRHEVENKQLELRKMIRDALTKKVK